MNGWVFNFYMHLEIFNSYSCESDNQSLPLPTSLSACTIQLSIIPELLLSSLVYISKMAYG